MNTSGCVVGDAVTGETLGVEVLGDNEGWRDGNRVGIKVVGDVDPEQEPTTSHFSCHKPNDDPGSNANPEQS